MRPSTGLLRNVTSESHSAVPSGETVCMTMKRSSLRPGSTWLLEAAALAAALISLALPQRADATMIPRGDAGASLHDLRPTSQHPQMPPYRAILRRDPAVPGARRPAKMSDRDHSAFSGIGVVACSAGGQTFSSTAFLVGAFDVGVTVAHIFARKDVDLQTQDCSYYSMDAHGQVRERIPLAAVNSQWDTDAGAFGVPTKDLAVIRLSRPSRYARRTMPLGKFNADAAPAVMVGFRRDISAGAVKRKARGIAYEHAGEFASSGVAGFIHDMDPRGVAAGSPIIDERTGVIIGIHTRLSDRHNAMITMNSWLEATLRQELQVRQALQAASEPLPEAQHPVAHPAADDAG